MFDGAKPRLRFSSPATNLSWKQPLSPLSSRADGPRSGEVMKFNEQNAAQICC